MIRMARVRSLAAAGHIKACPDKGKSVGDQRLRFVQGSIATSSAAGNGSIGVPTTDRGAIFRHLEIAGVQGMITP